MNNRRRHSPRWVKDLSRYEKFRQGADKGALALAERWIFWMELANARAFFPEYARLVWCILSPECSVSTKEGAIRIITEHWEFGDAFAHEMNEHPQEIT